MHTKKDKCKANSSTKPKGILSLIKISAVLTSGNLNDLLPYYQYGKIPWPYSPLA